MSNLKNDDFVKISHSFNKLVETFSPFYKNSYPGKYVTMPSFEMLEQYNDTICVLDFTTIGYNYVNKSVEVLELDKDRMLREGLSYSLCLFYDNEREIIVKEVFPVLFRYAQVYLENGKFPDFKAIYCSHLKLRTGEYQWFVHEVSILGMDPLTGHIIGLKQLRNIDHIKKDDDLDFVVFEKDEYGIFRVLEKKSFNLNTTDLSETIPSTGLPIDFSKRELDILTYIKKGFSSKEIAETLVISDHTVHNHRKNILKKSNGLNMMEIVQIMGNKKFI